MPTARQTDDPGATDLRRDLKDAQERLRATGEVLQALGRSGSDLDDVFRTVVHSAQRLCRGDAAQLHLYEGGPTGWRGTPGSRMSSGHSWPSTRSSRTGPPSSGGWGSTGAPSRSPTSSPTPSTAARTSSGWPVPHDHRAPRCSSTTRWSGVLSVWRTEVDPFDERRGRAADDVRRAGGDRAAQRRAGAGARGAAARAGAQGRRAGGAGEVGEAVSSSLDLDEVLDDDRHARRRALRDRRRVDHGVRRGRAGCSASAAAYGTSPEVVEPLRGDPDRRSTRRWSAGPRRERRAAAGAGPGRGRRCDPHLRTAAATPAGARCSRSRCVRRDRIVGALVVRRRTHRRASPTRRASCSRPSPASRRWRSINARLFRELEQQSARARGRQPAQVGVPRQHVARAAHAAQRGDRLLRGAARADVRRAQRAPGRVPARHPRLRASTCSSCSTRSSTCPRSRPGRWSWSSRTFGVGGAARVRASRWCASAPPRTGIDLARRGRRRRRTRSRPTSCGSSRWCSTCSTNAVKFTPDGGHGRRCAADARRGPRSSVTVTDTGIGVARDGPGADLRVLPAGRPRRAAAQEGTGLGLTLSPAHRRAARRPDVAGERGRARAARSASRSRPRDRAVAPTRLGTEARGGLPASSCVVDDDRPSLDLIDGLPRRRRPAGRGARATASEALERCAGALPAAVVLDIRLPGIDGWEVLRAQGGPGDRATIPVVVVSIVDERARGAALGPRSTSSSRSAATTCVDALRPVGALVPPIGLGPTRSRGAP